MVPTAALAPGQPAAVAATPAGTLPPFDAMYAAIDARDTRFDGAFYTAVTSTGIYCRPSCPAPTPQAKNVRFVRTAAQAQQLGFRPCLRCFPEALPGTAGWDPHATLTGQALALIEDGELDGGTVPQLAQRLGTSARTLNRLLTESTGAPALAHARAHRARTAFRLLASTDLSTTDIAFTAGFGSVRQFNETMYQLFARTPGDLRAAARRSPRPTAPGTPVSLSARLRYGGALDLDGLLRWFGARTLPGVDRVDAGSYSVGLRLPRGAGQARIGVDSTGQLRAHLVLDDAADLPAAVATARHLFDLDADSAAIDSSLSRHEWLTESVAHRPGARLPGEPTLTESLLRAICTQQVSVAAGRAQLTRLVQTVRDGDATATEPTRLLAFPSAAEALATLPGWFRGPGARRQALERTLALLAEAGEPADRDGTAALLERVGALKGVGPWTLAYAALRSVGDPDVDLSGDAALLSRARTLGLAQDRRGLETLLGTTRPWRSYAALHLWG
ncbi:Ada metal-binding domain-containing protein [Galactobacter caseinivorans]|uniref:DNA-3-methyladenine glycosylase 2 family protein n=1 Tax=Galactobacter caseinivorans TaxID=2676123 RepID=A0A496PGI3_9MICC|nr:Ada metal-binding domain-containing protein [Galactobacter caseinivorans]RKW69588.1 DNA-3-methyladenine glycosylase 2 family protein [Galactobacter caseinivorans]